MTRLHDMLDWLGAIDIYLLDQLMRGRIVPPMRVLDAGCGDGRNLWPLLRAGFPVWATDSSADAIAQIRAAAARLGAPLPADHVRCAAIESLDPRDGTFETVICNAVLHFARTADHFEAMVAALFAVLEPGGVFFARLASTITLEGATTPLGGERHRLPDGTERFLVSAEKLRELTQRHGSALLDPIKTVNVDGLRAMTTWVVRK